jgi:hypothetical protein
MKNTMKIKNFEQLCYILLLIFSGSLLIGTFFRNPYSYYVYLRWICFSTCLVFLIINLVKKTYIVVFISFLIALIYNPFFIVMLTREIWAVINIITVFLAALYIFINEQNDIESGVREINYGNQKIRSESLLDVPFDYQVNNYSIKKKLLDHDINGVWHFTDRQNIDLIKKYGGLLSAKELELRQIHVPKPGGNSWSRSADKSKGMDSYIHLSFTSEHPMLFTAKKEGRIPNPVLLKLKLDVVDIDGVRYTTDVSNKSGVELLTENEAINQIDFEGLRSNDFERKKTASKSEILVPKFIPLNMITGQKYG